MQPSPPVGNDMQYDRKTVVAAVDRGLDAARDCPQSHDDGKQPEDHARLREAFRDRAGLSHRLLRE